MDAPGEEIVSVHVCPIGLETVMESLRAHLLVAAPQLADPNFYRSVVLMIQHDEEGAFGVILNRPIPKTVGELWGEMIGGVPCDSSQPVNLGGPVSGPLMALHADEECSELEVLPGVYFATDKDYLDQIVTTPDLPFLIFSGYSGWGGGQLEGELKAGGWMTIPACYEHVFCGEIDLWKMVAQDIGEEITRPLLPPKFIPASPSSN